MKNTAKNRKAKGLLRGFTILELLIIIVVIGILATIILISFSGMQRIGRIASLKSDLKISSTQLGLDYVSGDDSYPSQITDANGGNGLLQSQDTIYKYVSTPNGYCLSATSVSDSTLVYHVSSDTNGAVEDGTCPIEWKQVTISGTHGCALSYDKKAYCWGDNTYGELGNNSTTSSLVPVKVNDGVLSGETIEFIEAGSYFTCAIASDGWVYCWGRNHYGQLGNGTTDNSPVPVAVNKSAPLGTKTITAISIGSGDEVNDYHVCVISSDSLPYCWGLGNYGQLGNGSTSSSSIPVAVNMSGALLNKTVKVIETDYTKSCVIASDNLAYCWGENWWYGRLGDGSYTNSPNPVQVYMGGVLSDKTIKMISTGHANACVVASDDKPYCWGGPNLNGQLGTGSYTNHSNVPQPVYTSGALNNKKIKAISTTTNSACVIASDDQVYCWGYNSNGDLGNNSTSHSNVPVPVDNSGNLSGLKVSSIASGGFSTVIIASDGSLYSWGANNKGQLGNNSTSNSSVPVPVTEIAN